MVLFVSSAILLAIHVASEGSSFLNGGSPDVHAKLFGAIFVLSVIISKKMPKLTNYMRILISISFGFLPAKVLNSGILTTQGAVLQYGVGEGAIILILCSFAAFWYEQCISLIILLICLLATMSIEQTLLPAIFPASLNGLMIFASIFIRENGTSEPLPCGTLKTAQRWKSTENSYKQDSQCLA